MPMTPSSHAADSTGASDTEGRVVPWTRLQGRLDRAGLLQGVHSGPDAAPVRALSVVQLADDSRMIRAGHLADSEEAGANAAEGAKGSIPAACFMAVAGTDTDGHAFIDDAIANGARLVVCERLPDEARLRFPEVSFVRVSDGRTALAEVAAAYYDDPSRELAMIGVTGTNGKTTVAYLAQSVLKAAGATTGLISTIEVRTGTVSTNAALTTPGSLELQRTLRRMVDDGCTACAMEVSSHALDQRRVHAVHYDVAIFTNLTAEHLDYHETLAAYRNAKKRLFDMLDDEAVAVVNADDPASAEMVADTPARILTYGVQTAGRRHSTRDSEAGAMAGLGGEDALDVTVEVLERRIEGLRLRLDGRERSLRLAGTFNAYNAGAAYTAGRALGHDGDTLADALAASAPVPGRFEQLHFDDGTTVVVDYAHTPDALENILSAIRDGAPAKARLWCVFGCGGDRDASKRRVMGSVAETLADRVVVTSDNPRTEEPEAILNDIRRGMSHPNRADWLVDRDAAIRFAAEHANPGDVVLIAGKGHETYQVVGTRRRAFDDRKVATRYFGARAAGLPT